MPSLPSDRSDGEALRDAGLALLRAHRAALVRDLTRAAVRIALDRGELTADDVRAAVPIPDGIRPVVVGAAIRDAADAGIIRRVGYRPSARAVAHARPLAVWALVDAAAALAWLAAHPPIPADPVPTADPHDYAI
jgi:hypothetical protein